MSDVIPRIACTIYHGLDDNNLFVSSTVLQHLERKWTWLLIPGNQPALQIIYDELRKLPNRLETFLSIYFSSETVIEEDLFSAYTQHIQDHITKKKTIFRLKRPHCTSRFIVRPGTYPPFSVNDLFQTQTCNQACSALLHLLYTLYQLVKLNSHKTEIIKQADIIIRLAQDLTVTLSLFLNLMREIRKKYPISDDPAGQSHYIQAFLNVRDPFKRDFDLFKPFTFPRTLGVLPSQNTPSSA
jgi:hypothetical protein